MIEIIICDDDKGSREAVGDLVKEFMNSRKIEYSVKKYADYDEKFIRDITPGGKKIYILDIETSSRSGIDVARIIRRRDVESIIIFVTGHEKFSKLVLKKNIMCLTFINKFDNLKEELKLALVDALNFLENNKVLRITDNGITYSIRLNSILYITRDSTDRRTIVECDKNEYRLKMSLTDMRKLLGSNFIQTHRSCFVNENRIDTIDHKNRIITFDNGEMIDLLSDTYRKDLK